MASPMFHAVLSASGSHKWLNCPPIVWQEMGVPDKNTVYTQEGTDAHRLSEIKLSQELGIITKAKAKSLIKKELVEGSDFYGPAMEEYTDEHIGLVMEDYNSKPHAIAELEVHVDFSEWAPGGFGTSDVAILSDGNLSIWDLKYGKGVPVYADHNPQLMLYALGAIAQYGLIYEFDTVTMNISQPRLGNVSSFTLPVSELLEWGEKVVKPRADEAINGRGEWNFDDPGTWRFFKAAGFSKALAEVNLRIRQYKFAEANTLKPEEIADILKQAPRIKAWLEKVEYYAMGQIKDGESIPGFKLVEGRSNRKISNVVGATAVLRAKGYLKRDIIEEKLAALGKLEKLTGGRAALESILGDYIIKPAGKPTVVPESDKRPAMGSTASAKADFSEEV